MLKTVCGLKEVYDYWQPNKNHCEPRKIPFYIFVLPFYISVLYLSNWITTNWITAELTYFLYDFKIPKIMKML